jgi:hypothetical protein
LVQEVQLEIQAELVLQVPVGLREALEQLAVLVLPVLPAQLVQQVFQALRRL